MVFKKHRNPESIIGIDVGTTSIRAVQIKASNGLLEVNKTIVIDIVCLEGENYETVVVQGLREIKEKLDFKQAQVVCALSNLQSIGRKVVAPPMPQKELAEAVAWAIKNNVPFSLDDAVMDFYVSEKILEGGLEKTIISAAAVPSQVVDAIVDIFSQVGINLSAIVPSFCCFDYIARERSEKDQEERVGGDGHLHHRSLSAHTAAGG